MDFFLVIIKSGIRGILNLSRSRRYIRSCIKSSISASQAVSGISSTRSFVLVNDFSENNKHLYKET